MRRIVIRKPGGYSALEMVEEPDPTPKPHPLYARPLVNRNPAQSNLAYAPGHEERPWAQPYGG